MARKGERAPVSRASVNATLARLAWAMDRTFRTVLEDLYRDAFTEGRITGMKEARAIVRNVTHGRGRK